MQNKKSLKTIRAISLSINHINNLFLNILPLRVSARPVIASPAALLRDIDILRVVKLRVRAILNCVYHSRFEVDQHGTGDVVVVVGLVEEDVFAILDLVAYCVLLEDAGWTDAVFSA